MQTASERREKKSGKIKRGFHYNNFHLLMSGVGGEIVKYFSYNHDENVTNLHI